jgi:hypothetical protein
MQHNIQMQSDQKENKQRMGVDNLVSNSQTLLYNKSYLLNFRGWNYHRAFHYYYYLKWRKFIK